MIPLAMRGGWVRDGIAVDGGELLEAATVWWLQAPSKHCDLRVPHEGSDGVMAFAGTTTWSDPALTWHPELELDRSVFEDVGEIDWDGEVMIETGSMGDGRREIRYVERWCRLAGSDGPALALSRQGGRLVRTGDYAITILDERPDGGPFAAVAWTLRDGDWSVSHTWPPRAAAPAPPAEIPAEGSTVVLGDGTEWMIDER